jgi:hypothetical protein
MQVSDQYGIKQTNQPVDHLSHLVVNQLNWLVHNPSFCIKQSIQLMQHRRVSTRLQFAER